MRRRFRLEFALGLSLLLLLINCKRAPNPDEKARHYEVRGIIRGLSPNRTTIEIQHEDIPGFMPSMTMPFSAPSSKEIVALRIGDGISFRMTVTDKDFSIDHIKKIPAEGIHVIAASPAPSLSPSAGARLREGDEMPFFSLTNQTGEPITRDTFRGHPFVLTFIFTRCPIPNFCPRMSNNFAELQNAIKTGQGALAQTRLFSITLDPQFDTPQILKEYGAHLQVDPNVWTLATGDPKEIVALTQAFSVYRQTEGGTISHGLATALVDAQGKIEKIWRGNGWTPAEVMQAIRTSK